MTPPALDLAAGINNHLVAARLAPSAGLRNVLVHQYAEIDLDQVVAAVGRARTDFRAYVRAIADGLAG